MTAAALHWPILTDLCPEVVALLRSLWLDQCHPPPHVVLLDAPGQHAHLVPGVGLVQNFVKGLDASHLTLGLLAVPNDLDVLANLITDIGKGG